VREHLRKLLDDARDKPDHDTCMRS